MMKRNGMRVWCCMVDDCEFVSAVDGMCPAHKTPLCMLILLVKSPEVFWR